MDRYFSRRILKFREPLRIPDLLPESEVVRLAAKDEGTSTLVFEEEGNPFRLEFFDFEDGIDLVVETEEEEFSEAKVKVSFVEGDEERISRTVQLSEGFWEGRFAAKEEIPKPTQIPYQVQVEPVN